MKKLILIRHAKSSWIHQVTDFERPLKRRGVDDAKLISKYAKERIFKPELVLSSDANRAKTTAEIFLKTINVKDLKLQLNHELYDFSGGGLTSVIRNCVDRVNHLMIFGHNHAITAFTNTFGSRYFDNVPTCGLVYFQFDIDSWKELNQGETIFSIFPKELKDNT